MTKASDQRDLQLMHANYVGIPQIHVLLNGVFRLEKYDAIAPLTAQSWVHRSTQARDGLDDGLISVPMPAPDLVVPGKRPRKFWRGNTIVAWYAEWKELTIPKRYR